MAEIPNTYPDLTLGQLEDTIDELVKQPWDEQNKRVGVDLVRAADRLLRAEPSDNERRRIEEAKIKVGKHIFRLTPDVMSRWRGKWGHAHPPRSSTETAPTAPKQAFLAFEWVEEREGKNHIAICSTFDKAKQACQRISDDACHNYGLPPAPLMWEQEGDKSWIAENPTGVDDLPYQVEPFDLDTVSVADDSQPNTRTFKQVQL